MTSTEAQSFSNGLTWHKSSYSGSAGGDCIEIAYDWRKSSHSGSEGGNCLEVATCPHAIHVRDSKNPDGPSLTLSATAWAAFLADVTN
ncbi:DUF397 domain-containing protein [Streptomyces sp. NBC_01456]|uniref:DUF397 domain-containing protein n=1 Tax=unclassified Streptomyces TaxID=2593676 RepID=UPI002E36C079|nr:MULTISPECIES: DUF397 domain-containing protein [unclassified Streptomyces]